MRDIHTVQDQRHDGIGVLICVLSQVHCHLSGGQCAAEDISARLGDVDHGVGVGLRLAVAVGLAPFSIGEILTLQIEHDVVCGVDSRRFIRRGERTVHSDAVV